MLPLLAALSLFNGNDLTGWAAYGPSPQFFARDKALHVPAANHVPHWIHTAREFEDFTLRFEYHLDQWAEAAVILRAPRTAHPQHAGLTVVLAHDFHNKRTAYTTGALMGVAPPLTLRPPAWGQWTPVEIELRGARLRVTIGGILVQDLAVPDHRLRRGVIGFPAMGYGYRLRNISVENASEPTKFIEPLQQEGWTKRGDSGEWTRTPASLVGQNGHSVFYSFGAYSDFEICTELITQGRVNSGIFIRGNAQEGSRGTEIQIYSPVDAVFPTGSLYNLVRSSLAADLEGVPFLLQIRAEGKRVRVWVDGVLVAEGEVPAGAGRIGFQIHSDVGRVEFRNIRIRPYS